MAYVVLANLNSNMGGFSTTVKLSLFSSKRNSEPKGLLLE